MLRNGLLRTPTSCWICKAGLDALESREQRRGKWVINSNKVQKWKCIVVRRVVQNGTLLRLAPVQIENELCRG